MLRFRLLPVTVAVLLAAAGAPALAATAPPEPVRVSGPSPFDGCATRPLPGEGFFPSAEVEPDVSSNPARPGNLIAVWQQDRFENGGARGIMAGYTTDGGRSWQRVPLPFSRCAPGGLGYQRASDPAVSIGPDGTAYAIGLSFDATSGRNAVATVVSRDGGRSWARLRVLTSGTGGGLDKEWVTADPVHPGTAYAVWDDLNVSADGQHFTGPSLFAKTTDFGVSWSTPLAIAAVGPDRQSIGNQIRVDARTGRLYDVYAYYFCTCLSIPEVAYVSSDDGGRTWSPQQVVSEMISTGVVQPGTQLPVRSGAFPVSAITPAGQLFVAWQDSRFSGGSHDEIALSTSKDGQHWTAPHRANQPTGRPAFVPAVAVTASGTAAITYYDTRRDQPRSVPFSTDYWATTTKDGLHFDGDRHLAGSFDLTTAPFARGLFLGDYQGLSAVGERFESVFTKTNCGDPSCARNPTNIVSESFPAQLTPGTSDSARDGAAAVAAGPSTSQPFLQQGTPARSQ